MITNLCAIKPYVYPDWLIEPEQDPYDTLTDGNWYVVQAIEDPNTPTEYEVIDATIRGWGEHNAVIRMTDPTYSHEPQDYLATITPDPS